MSNYEIDIKINIRKTSNEVSGGITSSGDGSFQMVIPHELGTSIDSCEQALLAVNYPAIRASLSEHLKEVSSEAADDFKQGSKKKYYRL